MGFRLPSGRSVVLAGPRGTVFPISSPLIKRENKDMHVIKKPDPSKQGSKERMGRNK